MVDGPVGPAVAPHLSHRGADRHEHGLAALQWQMVRGGVGEVHDMDFDLGGRRRQRLPDQQADGAYRLVGQQQLQEFRTGEACSPDQCDIHPLKVGISNHTSVMPFRTEEHHSQRVDDSTSEITAVRYKRKATEPVLPDRAPVLPVPRGGMDLTVRGGR